MDVGHYTQLAWAETYAVGCAYSAYTAGSGSVPDTQLVVCDYKPSGNFMGEVMYVGGTPASKCPTGTKRDSTYTGLCASSSQTDSQLLKRQTKAASALTGVKSVVKISSDIGTKPVKGQKESSAISKGNKRAAKSHKANKSNKSRKARKPHASHKKQH